MTLLQCARREERALRWAIVAKRREVGLLAMAEIARSWSCELVTRDAGCVLELAVIATAIFSGAHSSQTRSSRFDDLGYVPVWVVWASIVRPSAPSVIGTWRGFADSATGIRRISTPVS